MTNSLALVLGFLIIALFVVDYFFLHWGIPLFVGKKFADLSEFIAFWR